MNSFPQQPTPVPPQVELPARFPSIPQEMVDRFNEAARDWQKRLDEFWTKTNQAIQQAQEQTAKQVNSNVVFNVDSFLIYAGGRPVPMFALDVNQVRLGGVLTINTPNRTVYIGAGEFANENTPFYIDAEGNFSLGDSFVWDAETDTLQITGTINATTGTIGGFEIGSDYIRDVANTFGLSSTVTGGDDVRFWAGNTFANRNIAPLRIYESGLIRVEALAIDGVGPDQAIEFQKNTVRRWYFSIQGTESGGNSGSNLSFFRYDDAGNYIAEAFQVSRQTGRFLMNSAIDVFRTSIGTTSTDGLVLHNEQAATAGLNQWSPRLRWIGTGWKTNATAGSQFVEYIAELKTVTGAANPSGQLVFSSQVNSGGYSEIVRLGGDYGLYVATTAPNYFGGRVTVEASIPSDVVLNLRNTNSGATSVGGIGFGNDVVSFGSFIGIGSSVSGEGLMVMNLRNSPLLLGTNNVNRVIISNTGTVRVTSLAGVGTRTVVADAAGNLSAP